MDERQPRPAAEEPPSVGERCHLTQVAHRPKPMGVCRSKPEGEGEEEREGEGEGF